MNLESPSFNAVAGAGSTRVNRATPASSKILACPTTYTVGDPAPAGVLCGATAIAAHPLKPFTVNDDTYLAILRWIKEGALNNTDSQVGCN
jgi:hypothetical protein